LLRERPTRHTENSYCYLQESADHNLEETVDKDIDMTGMVRNTDIDREVDVEAIVTQSEADTITVVVNV